MDRRREEPDDAEEQLVERARDGDRAAFESLLRDHLARVWRVVWRILRHREDTEDVVQEVFMAAHTALAGFRSGSSFGTWLHRIAVNRALNHKGRSAERLRRASVPIDPPDVASSFPGAELAAPGRGPLGSIEDQEFASRLARCIERLPAVWRAALALRIEEDLAYQEIAVVMGTALGTVRSRLARARISLRECLGGEVP